MEAESSVRGLVWLSAQEVIGSWATVVPDEKAISEIGSLRLGD